MGRNHSIYPGKQGLPWFYDTRLYIQWMLLAYPEARQTENYLQSGFQLKSPLQTAFCHLFLCGDKGIQDAPFISSCTPNPIVIKKAVIFIAGYANYFCNCVQLSLPEIQNHRHSFQTFSWILNSSLIGNGFGKTIVITVSLATSLLDFILGISQFCLKTACVVCFYQGCGLVSIFYHFTVGVLVVPRNSYT